MQKTHKPRLKKTPLSGVHRELGAKMVAYAGYEMPVQYPDGIIAEHRHTRAAAGLFDVSHMGQISVSGPQAAGLLEALCPADLRAMPSGAARYSFFTNERGGIIDDLVIVKQADTFWLVVNAAQKDTDFRRVSKAAKGVAEVTIRREMAMLALQGPESAAVLRRLGLDVDGMPFMSAQTTVLDGVTCQISRSGYTGEDGFELAMLAEEAEPMARKLLSQPEVRPAGLGARDSLRLEAGLCLYGQDLDQATTPVEAGLAWAIPPRRRKEGGFPGDEVISRQLAQGPHRRRMGIWPQSRVIVRGGVALKDQSGSEVGAVTSGGFGPTAAHPVAIGYVRVPYAAEGVQLTAQVRGKSIPCSVKRLPFVEHRYKKSKSKEKSIDKL